MRRTLDKSQMLMSEAFLPTAKLIEFLKEETLIYQENWRTGFFFYGGMKTICLFPMHDELFLHANDWQDL